MLLKRRRKRLKPSKMYSWCSIVVLEIHLNEWRIKEDFFIAGS